MQKNKNKLALTVTLAMTLSCVGGNNTNKSGHGNMICEDEAYGIYVENDKSADNKSQQQDESPDFISIRVSNDTLYLVGYDEYAFFPFGKHKNPQEIPCLSKHECIEYETKDGIPVTCYIVDSSRLALSINQPGEYIFNDNISIVYASIKNGDITLERNIHVGMKYSEFLESLGIDEDFPNIRVIQWNTGLAGAQFLLQLSTEGEVSSINISSDYVMYEDVKRYLEANV